MIQSIHKPWIELTALAAIFGSLIFVGPELEQGRDVAIAGQ